VVQEALVSREASTPHQEPQGVEKNSTRRLIAEQSRDVNLLSGELLLACAEIDSLEEQLQTAERNLQECVAQEHETFQKLRERNEQLEAAGKAWPLIWAVERAYDHGNLGGDLLDAWLAYSAESSPATSSEGSPSTSSRTSAAGRTAEALPSEASSPASEPKVSE
jgi:hypothetical protein